MKNPLLIIATAAACQGSLGCISSPENCPAETSETIAWNTESEAAADSLSGTWTGTATGDREVTVAFGDRQPNLELYNGGGGFCGDAFTAHRFYVNANVTLVDEGVSVDTALEVTREIDATVWRLWTIEDLAVCSGCYIRLSAELEPGASPSLDGAMTVKLEAEESPEDLDVVLTPTSGG